MKKSIIAALAGIAFSMFISTAASAGPVLQLRLASETASDDAERMTYVTHNAESSWTNVLYVQKAVLLDESMLKSAYSTNDALGHLNIELIFNDTGRERFADVTSKNVGKQLAIILDGKIYQAPSIRMGITGGTAQISGRFSKAEVKNMVKKLNEAVKSRSKVP
jgi:preprotein translocase subunit SecD